MHVEHFHKIHKPTDMLNIIICVPIPILYAYCKRSYKEEKDRRK